MGISHEHATQDDVRDILHFLPTSFDRERLLGPRQIVTVLMTMIREQCGYERGIALVNEHHGDALGWNRKRRGHRARCKPPSAGAFCRARQNLLPAELLAMYQAAVESPMARAARARWLWKGHRLLAADGVRFLLPATQPIIDEWCRPKVTGGEAYQPQLLQVAIWDVGAVQPLSWVQVPCHGKGYGERSTILHLLDTMQPGDVLLLDRGFPSRRLLHELVARGIHFVIRMTASGTNDFAEVERFMAGRAADAEVDFAYHDLDLAEPLVERLRLVRRTDKDGNVRVLVTDLRDRETYTKDDLFAVYCRRWGIENAFRDLKIRYAAEHFHGTTPQFIEQEIIVLMLLMLLESLVEETAIMALPPSERPRGDDVRPKRHNRAALGDRLPTLIGIALRTRAPRGMRQAFSRGIAAISRCRTTVCRPRAFPRICKSQYGRWRFERKSKGGELLVAA
jgi:Transposase DDE domain